MNTILDKDFWDSQVKQRDDTLNDYKERCMMMNNLERGTRLSQSVQWRGQDIFEIAQAAFEDANYHTFNEVFTEAWNEFNQEMNDDND